MVKSYSFGKANYIYSLNQKTGETQKLLEMRALKYWLKKEETKGEKCHQFKNDLHISRGSEKTKFAVLEPRSIARKVQNSCLIN